MRQTTILVRQALDRKIFITCDMNDIDSLCFY